MAKDLLVRFRVDFGRHCSIGIGKIELLEAIAVTGSLSEAARTMRMSYRRAWLLLADLNVSFEEKVALTTTGGRGGGGVRLTPFGERLIDGYRRMEASLQALAEGCFGEILKRVAPARGSALKRTVPLASIRRKTLR